MTNWALVKILRRVLSRDHADFKNQVVTGGLNPGNVPPLKEGPDLNTVQLSNLVRSNGPRNFRGEVTEVVVGRQEEFTRAREVESEVAGGGVEVVGGDGGGEEADGEVVGGEDGVWCSRRR